MAQGCGNHGHGGVCAVSVRGASGAGRVRWGRSGEIHRGAGPGAHGLLLGPRGHQLSVPDGGAAADGAQRSVLPERGPAGGGHRNHHRQVQVHQDRPDAAVRGVGQH